VFFPAGTDFGEKIDNRALPGEYPGRAMEALKKFIETFSLLL